MRNRTFQYARRIIRLYCALPKNELAHVIGKQFLRSGTSVGANYREAFRSRSRAEFLAKTGDCLKEIEETAYWLELIEVETIIDPALLVTLLDETRQLIAIFVSITKTTKQNVIPSLSATS
ncbi:four helix bundle protein [Opitutaceae bacterium TAV4]|nr:four helix bundle protein [Opitutaceae bacterium TAV4]RRK01122.1 four helix bundle protein [Opitutaceae bacterium TAV3]